MSNSGRGAFAAIFANEVLLNSKRVAPYALMALFAANAVLWWGWGPAVARGWATNSDFYIHRNLSGFSFILGLPIVTAVMMGDAVIRDFRLGIVPLIFSTPISRAVYILGKFCGNFFVLVCCQSAFALTMFLLQWVPFTGMVVQPARVLPYFKHFFFVVVISHLVLAAFYFTVGTITRNAKVVYGLAACFYPGYVAYQLLLKNLSIEWRVLLDPLAFNFQQDIDPWNRSAEFLNQYIVPYSSAAYTNRALMIVVSAAILLVLYFRFSITERPESASEFSKISLLTAAEAIINEPQSSIGRDRGHVLSMSETKVPEVSDRMRTHQVTSSVSRVSTALSHLVAGLGMEFTLLRAEKSLVVLMPLAAFISTLEIAFFPVSPEISYSAAYAENTTNSLLLIVFGMTVFYTGEAVHRDREVRMLPVLWSTPISNSSLLLSKFLATVVLMLSLIVFVGLLTIMVQVLREHTPIDVFPFMISYSVVLLPNVILVTACTIALNIILRDKYLAYALIIGTAGGLFYLYSTGHSHLLNNPLLYRLWSYADLIEASNARTTILWQRLYCLGIAGTCLSLACLAFPRKTTKRLWVDGRLSGKGWSMLLSVSSFTSVLILALLIAKRA